MTTYRAVRRKDHQTDSRTARDLLERGEYGVLSTVDNDGQPYGVPVSYAFDGQSIYFHCALEGHKLDNLRANPRVSFCVVGSTRVLPEKFATLYESAVVFGEAFFLEGPEKTRGLELLAAKYSPEHAAAGQDYIEKHFEATRVVCIRVNHISGKAKSG